MWIKWKYNDHGNPDFRELEIPDDLDGYESVPEYLMARDDLRIPVWSERFMVERIKWCKINLSPEELTRRTVMGLQADLGYHRKAMNEANAKLKALLKSAPPTSS